VSLIPAFEIGIWNAWLFMSVFIIQMLIMMFADKSIQQKTHVPKETKRNSNERYAGTIANIVSWIALGYSVFLPIQLDTVWFYIGLSVFVIGLIILTIATSDFMTTPADVVITKGIYRFSRHPMYLSAFLICLGSGIAAASWLFIIGSVIMISCLRQEALVEERYCLDKYGDAYRRYLNSVPRWFGVPGRTG
jgi:protein-S-isoprenylcysteine O-methyltransferase Ste14